MRKRILAVWRKPTWVHLDRKSTRLNSSHVKISYAGFGLKKKKDRAIHPRHREHRHVKGSEPRSAAAGTPAPRDSVARSSGSTIGARRERRDVRAVSAPHRSAAEIDPCQCRAGERDARSQICA